MLTSLDFIRTGQPWPPEPEQERLKLYSDNIKLFEGKHEQVYKNWVRLLRDDQKATLEIILNWPKRLSTLWADLLLGEPPRITAGNKGTPEQEAVERILEENSLINTAYEVALDVSRLGTGCFKIRYDQRGIIEGQPPSVWFPVVAPDNIKQVLCHVLAWRYQEGAAVKRWYLNVEIHERGRITFQRWTMNSAGERIGNLLEERVQETGVDYFLVVPVNNILTTDRVTGLDDYSDLDGILQELETRVAQISRILDKHADPSMYGPDTAASIDPLTGKVTYLAGGRYFPIMPDEDPPGYITWDGQLEASFKQIENLMEQLYAISETSPAAFGQLKTGLAESGSALRRLMLAPLAKINRIRMRFDPALKEALYLAAALEVAQHKSGAVTLESIRIDWQEGLPVDEIEQTDIETQRKTAGLTSTESALKRLYGLEGEALQEELQRILDEADASMPQMFKSPLPKKGDA